MIKMISAAASGLRAGAARMDRISGHITNTSTPAFKRGETTFAELARSAMAADSVSLNPGMPADQQSLAGGVRAMRSLTDFRQGSLMPAEHVFNLGIEGEGFLGAISPDGRQVLTRKGSFFFQASGMVTDENGYGLEMETYTDPATWDPEALTIGADGMITGRQGDQVTQLGRIALYGVTDTNTLLAERGGYYTAADPALVFAAGERPGATGTLVPYRLEGSNVDLMQELTDMIRTQRNFQANARAVTAADDMMNIFNSILS